MSFWGWALQGIQKKKQKTHNSKTYYNDQSRLSSAEQPCQQKAQRHNLHLQMDWHNTNLWCSNAWAGLKWPIFRLNRQLFEFLQRLTMLQLMGTLGTPFGLHHSNLMSAHMNQRLCVIVSMLLWSKWGFNGQTVLCGYIKVPQLAIAHLKYCMGTV